MAEVSRSLKKTGGGKADHELSQETSLICSLIPVQMASLENEFDSDNLGILMQIKGKSL